MLDITSTQTVTTEEFEQFIYAPENLDRNFEHINGMIVDTLSTSYASSIAATIAMYIGFHVWKNELGVVTGADGGYVVNNQQLIPDVAFVSNVRQSDSCDEAYNPLPPDLAIEVNSRLVSASNLRLKLGHYLKANVTVWIVDPQQETIEIFAPNETPKRLTTADTLEGGNVLPNFTLPVAEIFQRRDE